MDCHLFRPFILLLLQLSLVALVFFKPESLFLILVQPNVNVVEQFHVGVEPVDADQPKQVGHQPSPVGHHKMLFDLLILHQAFELMLVVF